MTRKKSMKPYMILKIIWFVVFFFSVQLFLSFFLSLNFFRDKHQLLLSKLSSFLKHCAWHLSMVWSWGGLGQGNQKRSEGGLGGGRS